jgi:hypothetical protein
VPNAQTSQSLIKKDKLLTVILVIKIMDIIQMMMIPKHVATRQIRVNISMKIVIVIKNVIRIV